MQNVKAWPNDIFAKDITEIVSLIENDRAAYLCEKKLILAAFPKSGSTYICKVLAHLLRHEVDQKICNQTMFTPKDITLTGIYRSRGQKTISQLHIFASGGNLQYIKAFDMKVAVLVRNVFDVVVSLNEHMEKINYFAGIIPIDVMRDMTINERVDYIIDVLVPWLLTFYYSWLMAERRGDAKLAWLRYEDMVKEPTAFFTQASNHFSVNVSYDAVAGVLAETPKDSEHRFNVGRVGRGAYFLSPGQISRVKYHANFYKNLDLSLIGL